MYFVQNAFNNTPRKQLDDTSPTGRIQANDLYLMGMLRVPPQPPWGSKQ